MGCRACNAAVSPNGGYAQDATFAKFGFGTCMSDKAGP